MIATFKKGTGPVTKCGAGEIRHYYQISKVSKYVKHLPRDTIHRRNDLKAVFLSESGLESELIFDRSIITINNLKLVPS
jgi:hypothetical protein